MGCDYSIALAPPREEKSDENRRFQSAAAARFGTRDGSLSERSRTGAFQGFDGQRGGASDKQRLPVLFLRSRERIPEFIELTWGQQSPPAHAVADIKIELLISRDASHSIHRFARSGRPSSLFGPVGVNQEKYYPVSLFYPNYPFDKYV